MGDGLTGQRIKITVDFVHAAILAALAYVQRLPYIVKVFAPLFALPYLFKAVGIDVAIGETLVQQISAATINLAVGHHVRPEKRRGMAFLVARSVLLGVLFHGVVTIYQLKPVCAQRLQCGSAVEV